MKKFRWIAVFVAIVSLFAVSACIDANESPTKDPEYVVTATQTVGGDLDWEGRAEGKTFVKGSDLTVSVSVERGYRLTLLTVGGVDYTQDGADGEIVYRNITQDLQIVAQFTKRNATVFFIEPCEGGEVIAPDLVYPGEAYALSVTPQEGYVFRSLTVDGVDVTAQVADGSYQATASETHTVSALFAELHDVSLTQSAGGALTSDVTTAPHGSVVTVAAVADEGYCLVSLTVGGVECVQAVHNNTFSFVLNADTAIAAVFQKTQYVVTVNSSQYGTCAYQVSADGDSVTFTLTPDLHCEIVSLTVDGAAVTLTNGTYVCPLTKNLHAEAVFQQTEYQITVAPNVGGVIQADKQTAVSTEPVTVTVVPNEGYELTEVMLNGKLLGQTNGAYVFYPTQDSVITTTFVRVYSVKIESVSGPEYGSIFVDTSVLYREGSTVTVSVTLNDGKSVLTSLTVNGTEQVHQVENGVLTFEIQADTVISAQFGTTAVSYTVTYQKPQNGSLTYRVSEDDEPRLTVTATPDEHYRFVSFLIDGAPVETAEPSYETVLVKNVTLSAVFAPVFYQVSLTQTANGTLSADKTQTTHFETVTFTVEPDLGYELNKLYVNGEEVDAADNVYVLQEATEDVTVRATFKRTLYDITLTQTEGGTLTSNKAQASRFDAVTITVTPEDGYRVVSLTVNGKQVVLSNNTYSFVGPTAPVTAQAVFEKIKYSVIITQTEGGSLTADKAQATVFDTVTFTVTPDVGYRVVSLTIGGKQVALTSNTYAFAKPTAHVTAKATFEKITYQVTAVQSTGGTVALQKATMTYFDTNVVTVTPQDGYVLSRLFINGDVVAVNGNAYEISRPTEDVEVRVQFTFVGYAVSVTQSTGGTISVDKTQALPTEQVTVSITLQAEYELLAVYVNGIELTPADGVYAFRPTCSSVVTATYKRYFANQTYKGKVVYEDGVPARGITVTAKDSSVTAVTDAKGEYAITLPNGEHLLTAATQTDWYASSVTAPRSEDEFVAVASDILLVERKVGVSVGSYTSTTTDVAFGFDGKSVTVDGNIDFNGDPLYFKNGFAENGAVFFTVTNLTDTSVATHETDPGVGVFVKSASFNVVTHIVGSNSRILANGSWSNVPYGGANTEYNIHNIGVSYKFAFVKQEDTVYLLTATQSGYRVIQSYTNALLEGEFAFAMITSTNPSKFTESHVRLSEMRFTTDKTVINELIGADLTVAAPNASYVVENCYAKRSVRVIVTPDEGYSVRSASVEGKQAEVHQMLNGEAEIVFTMPSASATLTVVTQNELLTVAYDGADSATTYDGSLFYRNDQAQTGADPGVMYVSVEDDPVYGGWFYMTYTSGETNDGSKTTGAFQMVRSRDLANWEICGALSNGYCLQVNATDWAQTNFWAPELLHERANVGGVMKNRYYIYFSARSKVGNADTEYSTSPDSVHDYNRLYIGIGVSDTPVGPYKMVDTSTYYAFYNKTQTVDANGNAVNGKTPAVNFYRYNPEIQQAYQKAGISADYWPAIDVSPFIDEATGDMYMYFSQHVSAVSAGNVIWVMKMKDYITPDYTSMHVVSIPGYSVKATDFKTYVNKSQTYSQTAASKVTRFHYDGDAQGNGINEGAFTISHYDETQGKWFYYLTYSPFGYGSRAYSVLQAVSTSPNGPFTKIDPRSGQVVIGMLNWSGGTGIGSGKLDYSMKYDFSASIDYLSGTGHHCFVKAGDEIFAVYHCFRNPIDNNNASGSFMGRDIAADRVYFVQSPTLTMGTIVGGSGSQALPVLYGNGPTASVQPLPAVSSGYANVASKATVTASGSGKEYLTDGLFVTHTYYKNWEYQAEGAQTITFEFATVQNMRGIMVYNSAQYAYALKSLRQVKLTLADGSVTTFDNLKQPAFNAYDAKSVMRYGGSISATFQEVAVKKVEISIHPDDKFNTSNTSIRIGDVVLLARESGEESSLSLRNSGGVSGKQAALDGVAEEAVWQNKRAYEEDFGLFKVKAVAALGEDGVYVTATVTDTAMFSTGNNNETTPNAGLNRSYKNTTFSLYLTGSTNPNAKNVSMTFTAQTARSNGAIGGAIRLDGELNSGRSKSFTVEAFAPYSAFDVTSLTEVYVGFTYKRMTSTSDTAPITYAIRPEFHYQVPESYMVFGQDGYGSVRNAVCGSSALGHFETGIWTISGNKATLDSMQQSEIWLSREATERFVFSTKINLSKVSPVESVVGVSVATRQNKWTFALDATTVKNGQLPSLKWYKTDQSGTSFVYEEKAVYSATALTLTVAKNNNQLVVSVGNKQALVFSSSALCGDAAVGLYGKGVKGEFGSLTFTDYVGDAQGYYAAYGADSATVTCQSDEIVNVIQTPVGKTIEVYLPSGKSVSSLTANGKTLSVNGNGTYAVAQASGDLFVALATQKISGVTVSGTLYRCSAPTCGTVTLAGGGAKYYAKATPSYSLVVPSGSYEVVARTKDGAESTSRINASSSLTHDVSTETVGVSQTIAGNTLTSASGNVLSSDGATVTTADNRSLGTSWFSAPASSYAVIDFTVECFLNRTGMASGTYEGDATVGVLFSNGTQNSVVAYHGRSARTRATTVGWNPEHPANNVLPFNLSANGTVLSLRFVNIGGKWSMYYYDAGRGGYVFTYSYDAAAKGAVSGNCVYGVTLSTSFKYTRIRLANCSIITDEAAVRSVYAAM